MTEYRSTSGDNLKLMLAFLGMACFSGATYGLGVIPVGIVLLGALLAWRSRDTKNVRVTARFAQFSLTVAFSVLLYNLVTGFVSSHEEVIFGAATCFWSAIGLELLWIGPVTRKIDALDPVEERTEDEAPAIMQRESLATFSTADELRKWRDLLNDGTITQKQFDDARQKLLG